MRVLFYHRVGIGDGNRETGFQHDRQIDNIVSDERCLLGREAKFGNQLLIDRQFILRALVKVFDVDVARAVLDHL